MPSRVPGTKLIPIQYVYNKLLDMWMDGQMDGCMDGWIRWVFLVTLFAENRNSHIQLPRQSSKWPCLIIPLFYFLANICKFFDLRRVCSTGATPPNICRMALEAHLTQMMTWHTPPLFSPSLRDTVDKDLLSCFWTVDDFWSIKQGHQILKLSHEEK